MTPNVKTLIQKFSLPMDNTTDLFDKRKSFEAALLPEIDPLNKMARHFVHETQEIEDLVQDTLLKALRFYEKFSLDTDIRKWLYTIMRNTFINQARRNGKRRDHELLLSSSHREISSISPVFGKFILDDVNRVISDLPVKVSEAVNMFNVGYKYHEISKATSQPIGTVKTRIRAARLALAERFNLPASSNAKGTP